MCVEANDDRKLANALEQSARFGAADGRAKRIQGVHDVEAVTSEFIAIDCDFQFRRAGQLFGLYIGSAGDLPEQFLQFLRGRNQSV